MMSKDVFPKLPSFTQEDVANTFTQVNSDYAEYLEATSVDGKCAEKLMAIVVCSKLIDVQLSKIQLTAAITSSSQYKEFVSTLEILQVCESLFKFFLIEMNGPDFESDDQAMFKRAIDNVGDKANAYLNTEDRIKTADMVIAMQKHARSLRDHLFAFAIHSRGSENAPASTLPVAIMTVSATVTKWVEDSALGEWVDTYADKLAPVSEFKTSCETLIAVAGRLDSYFQQNPKETEAFIAAEGPKLNGLYESIFCVLGASHLTSIKCVKALASNLGNLEFILNRDFPPASMKDETMNAANSNPQEPEVEEVVIETVTETVTVEEEKESLFKRGKNFFNKHKPSRKVMIYTGAAVATATAVAGGVIWYRNKKEAEPTSSDTESSAS